jgi:uncharacterized damage-inducible protein DinB
VTSVAYVATMAAYNAEMNRRIYAAAGRLDEAERRRQRGAFWGSIHGTLNHLVWGDRIWMSRFAGWPAPAEKIRASSGLIEDFASLTEIRSRMDADIIAWSAQLTDAWLEQEMAWMSAAAGCEIRKPHRLLVTHFFNHQTHHRGQVHAMLTAAGQDTGDTDLFLLVD